MIRISFECVFAMMARGSTQGFLRTADDLDIGHIGDARAGSANWGATGLLEQRGCGY